MELERRRVSDLQNTTTCLFPLKKLLEKDESATLASVEESELISEPETLTSKDIYFIKPRRKTFLSKRDMLLNQSEINQCLITIFDDAIDQIHIISGGKKSENTIDEFNQTLEEKVQNQFLYDPIFDKVTCDPYPVYFTKQKLKKVLTDCSIVNEFLVLMRSELKEENALKCMRTITNNIIHRRNEEQYLLYDEQNNFKILKNCKQLIEIQHKETQRYLEEIKRKLYETIDETDVLLFENILREKYVKDWESARREQSDLFCKRAEDHLQRNIEKCDKEIETEIRVFSEEETFLMEEEEDIQYNIKHWSERLITETDQRTIQNQKLKEDCEDINEAYENLVQLYEHQKREITCYLRLKERRAREWEKRERLRIAATKIQAWWRGMMVRHQLGPFNPRKGRRGRKGRKGKKGKKGKTGKKKK